MNNFQKRVIFVLSKKGGAGKTTFARALLDIQRSEGYRVAAYDADGAVGQLFQHYGLRDAEGRLIKGQDPMEGCGFFDIRAPDERDILLNALTGNPPIILFDLPGGLVGELGKVVDDGAAPRYLFKAYQDGGYAITIVVVMTPVNASIRTVQESVRIFGDAVEYVAVKNLAFGQENAFVLFDGSTQDGLRLPESESKKALLEKKGIILKMPALDPRTYALLDVYNLGFVDAIKGQTPGRILPRADQVRVCTWMQEFDEFIKPARLRFGLSADVESTEAAMPPRAPIPALV